MWWDFSRCLKETGLRAERSGREQIDALDSISKTMCFIYSKAYKNVVANSYIECSSVGLWVSC